MNEPPKHSWIVTIVAVLFTAIVAGAAGYWAGGHKVFAPKVMRPPPVAVPAPPPVLAAAPKAEHAAGTLRLDVQGLDPAGRLPLDYTCYRQNISPPLKWSGAPAGTKSFTAVLARPDKPRDAIYWAVFDIPASANGLGAGLPRAPQFRDGTMQALNDHGDAAYIGPCEAHGLYHFVFRLYALDTMLPLKPPVANGALFAAMQGHVIDEAEVPVVHYLRMGGAMSAQPAKANVRAQIPAKAGNHHSD